LIFQIRIFNKKMMKKYTPEELREDFTEFIESCHRTGHHRKDYNIKFFLQENDHMGITQEEVEAIYDECDWQDDVKKAASSMGKRSAQSRLGKMTKEERSAAMRELQKKRSYKKKTD